MQCFDELETLERIIFIIKAHQQLLEEDRTAIDAYLRQNLSTHDWLVWQRLQVEDISIRHEEEMFALKRFELLLMRYKRTGYEYYHFWLQCYLNPTA
jgi:putative NIF3 family GTP cyclohydrolase 1 type 2